MKIKCAFTLKSSQFSTQFFNIKHSTKSLVQKFEVRMIQAKNLVEQGAKKLFSSV